MAQARSTEYVAALRSFCTTPYIERRKEVTMHTHQSYAVYHANDLFAMVMPEASHWHEDRSQYYTHVADVEAPLAQVFALTNHIDHSWTSNPQVVWHATTAPLRSTSVGDVIMSY